MSEAGSRCCWRGEVASFSCIADFWQTINQIAKTAKRKGDCLKGNSKRNSLNTLLAFSFQTNTEALLEKRQKKVKGGEQETRYVKLRSADAVYHSYHMMWISAWCICFWLHSRAGPHNRWRAAAAGHNAALRTILPCTPSWISMDFSARAARRVTFWIIPQRRKVLCGTELHWGGTVIGTVTALAHSPEFARWDNMSSAIHVCVFIISHQ